MVGVGVYFVPASIRLPLLLVAGGVIGAIAVVMSAGSLFFDRSWDEQLRLALVWLRRSLAELDNRTVDDRKALGTGASVDRFALEDDAQIVQLDATNARRLARTDPLVLNHVRGISEGAAY